MGLASAGMSPRGRLLYAALALLFAWVPWLGAVLALLGLALVARDARQGVLLGLALLLGVLSTAAYVALPEGSLRPDDPRLDLLEDRFQPGGNSGEIESHP